MVAAAAAATERAYRLGGNDGLSRGGGDDRMPLSLLFRIDVRRTTAIFFSWVSNNVIANTRHRGVVLLFGQNCGGFKRGLMMIIVNLILW
jgi:hypothetical protein